MMERLVLLAPTCQKQYQNKTFDFFAVIGNPGLATVHYSTVADRCERMISEM
jgi:hypothetical protein